LGYLNERSNGDIKTVLNEDIEKLELFLAHNLPELIYYLIGPVTVFVYLLSVNVPLALVSLIPLFLSVLVMGTMFSRTGDMMARANKSLANFNSVVIEYISGMKLIKAYNMGSTSFQKFSNTINEENTVWNEMSRKMGPPYAAFVILIECGMLLMVPLGGMLFLKGSITASVFLLFAFIGSLYLTEIRPLQELGNNFAQVLAAVNKSAEILAIPAYDGGGDFPGFHDIELRDVNFSYNGKTNVLDHCSLKISNGQKLALIGRSGAGKTTVIELVSRFYDVQEGEVLIGGKNVKDIKYELLLKNISIVFQKDFLTRDSVLENIRMGSNATFDDVREAAKKARIDSFIMSLPQGYDTKVGSFGSRFSGGERQRIAIARAILKNAPILILDEAASATDPESQVEIDLAIRNLCDGKTVIIVAHRLGAVRMCDQVAIVENHTISCIGRHEDVYRENDYYRRSWIDYEVAREIGYRVQGDFH
jgi:ATP-binding cassette subfamily B protein